MPATAQPNVGLLQGWSDLEDGWGEAMNANLRVLDLAVMPRVLSRTLTTPPGSPTAGDAYIIASSPTGAWASRAGQLARWSGAAWEGLSPLARGNRDVLQRRREGSGPIPARAGEPKRLGSIEIVLGAYPRSRGGTPSA